MKWEKMSQEAAQRLENLVKPFDCTKKPMFGYDVYWVKGNMFTGIFQSRIFFRLSPEDRKIFLGKYSEAAVFEPMAGRPMKDYIVIPESVLENKVAIDAWLQRSYDFTMSLPEKKAKPKKK